MNEHLIPERRQIRSQPPYEMKEQKTNCRLYPITPHHHRPEEYAK